MLCRWLLTKCHDKLNHVWYLIFANVNNYVFFKHVCYFITIEIERCIFVFWKFYLMNWRNVNTRTLPPLKLSFKCRVKFSRHNLQLQHCSVRVNYCAPDKKRHKYPKLKKVGVIVCRQIIWNHYIIHSCERDTAIITLLESSGRAVMWNAIHTFHPVGWVWKGQSIPHNIKTDTFEKIKPTIIILRNQVM